MWPRSAVGAEDRVRPAGRLVRPAMMRYKIGPERQPFEGPHGALRTARPEPGRNDSLSRAVRARGAGAHRVDRLPAALAFHGPGRAALPSGPARRRHGYRERALGRGPPEGRPP